MTELQGFLASLRELGIKLWVDGDKLKVRAGEGVLSPELARTLKERKAEILSLLRPEPVYSITPLPPRDSYELSAAQRRLWVLAQLPEASAAYNIPLHQLLEGPLDRAALEAAFARVVERHESLRTAFVFVDGEPRQVVHAGVPASIEFQNLAGEANPEDVARQLGSQEATRPFDLEVAPLWRVRLLKLAEQQHVLLFTMHHLIADGVSLGVLARDLSELYKSARTGRPDSLPALPFGYPAFAAWHNRLLGSDLMVTHRRYWHGILSGPPAVLDLPTDYPRPPVQRFRGRELSFTLGPERLAALQAFARRRNATLFMAVHAIVKVLLFAYSGQDDVVVGCAVAGREHPHLPDQIGLYLNTLALRSRISSAVSFNDFFAEVAELTKEAFDHQVYPFDQLVGELDLARDLSRFPLFDVMLIEQNQDEPGLGLHGLLARPIFEHNGTSKFDLTFCFKAIPESGLLLSIEYSTDLFCEDRVRRMGGHFLRLIDSILADPFESVGRLNVLPDRERRQLIDEFNHTTAPYPQDRSIVDLLEAAAARSPDAVALICGRRELNCRELHARANQLAWHLQSLGVEPGSTVGICLERSPELVVALLAVLKAGAAYLPLDPRHPPDRLAHIIDDAQVSVLVRNESHRIPHRQPTRSIDLQAERSSIARHPEEPPPRHIQPEHPAYVIYTSGTTGRPKGVEIPHRALTNFLVAMMERPGLTDRDGLLAVTTVSFDIAALEIYLPLVRNARLILAEDDDIADGLRLLSLIETSGATTMQATPSTWQSLLSAGWQGTPGFKAICGGEALPGWLGEQLLARADSVWNMYGPTETTVWSTMRKLERNDVRRDAVESIGRPIANTQVYILDRQMRPVPIGVPGDLHIGGDGLALRYRNLPELTAERFLPHPFESGGNRRVYKTGDIARYRENGDIEYLGRSDQQVKLRGFRIETAEIEAVLTTHPGIGHVVVDAREDAAGDKRLIAWYVPLHGRPLPAAELRDHLKRKLPDYMIPALFVATATLPTTPNGKVDRKALREPDQDQDRTAAYVAPRTEWEQTLVRLWQEILNVPRLGIHDNFFERGGHSLKATAFLARLQRETGVRLGLVDVFRYPSVAGLAANCVAHGGDGPIIVSPADSRLDGTGSLPDADHGGIRPATAEELEILGRL